MIRLARPIKFEPLLQTLEQGLCSFLAGLFDGLLAGPHGVFKPPDLRIGGRQDAQHGRGGLVCVTNQLFGKSNGLRSITHVGIGGHGQLPGKKQDQAGIRIAGADALADEPDRFGVVP